MMIVIAVIGIIIYNFYKKDRNYKMIAIIKIIVAFFAEPDFRYTNFFKLTEPDFRYTIFFYYCSLKVLYLKTDSHFRYTNIFIVPPVLKFSKLRQNQILDTQTFLLFPLFLNFCSLRRSPIVSTQIFLLFPLFKTNSNVRQNPMSGTQTFYCSPSFNFSNFSKHLLY